MPSFAGQLMPPPLFNALIRSHGIRMTWMKSHVCPCTMSSDSPGSPNPTCNTCHGRGRYWDQPQGPFVLLRTFMHSTEAADEPGATMDAVRGQELHAEPTITIPSDVLPVWSEASEFDAYVEVDTMMRFETAFVTGGNTVLPYQQNVDVESVTAYDTTAQDVVALSESQWTNNDGQISLIGFANGTAFTVSYKANPVYIAWRRSGANAHMRLFGAGTAALPVRFRAQWLDAWIRARNPGGQSASPAAI